LRDKDRERMTEVERLRESIDWSKWSVTVPHRPLATDPCCYHCPQWLQQLDLANSPLSLEAATSSLYPKIL